MGLARSLLLLPHTAHRPSEATPRQEPRPEGRVQFTSRECVAATGEQRRHPLDETALQHAVRAAASALELSKTGELSRLSPFVCHTLAGSWP